MSDLPQNGLLQQQHARPVSGEHLEVLGKQASSKWSSGECPTLNDAVVETVKHAGLSPEQVKRVVEFANTDAYLREFKKEGSDHKYIDFGTPGPANASDVLKDLNDGGGGSVFDRGTLDYDGPPPEKTAASAIAERHFTEVFSAPEAPMLQADPFREVMDLKDKLAGAYNNLGSEIETLELQYADVADRMYGEVKQAALNGVTLGQVLQAWSSVAPTADFAKVAFQLFTPRLLREQVFGSAGELTGSMAKTASESSMVNEAHPLVLGFKEYCETLQKLAEFRSTREDVRGHVANLTAFLKQADGVIPAVWNAAKGVSRATGKGVGGAVKALSGSEQAGDLTEGAIAHAPHLAALLAANEAKLHLEGSPAFHHVMSVVPGTQEHEMHKMQVRGY